MTDWLVLSINRKIKKILLFKISTDEMGASSFLSRTSPPDTMGYCSLAVMLLLKGGGGGVYLPLFEESTRRPHDGRWSLATADVIKSLKKKSHSHDASAKFASFLLDWWRFHTNNVSFFFFSSLPPLPFVSLFLTYSSFFLLEKYF